MFTSCYEHEPSQVAACLRLHIDTTLGNENSSDFKLLAAEFGFLERDICIIIKCDTFLLAVLHTVTHLYSQTRSISRPPPPACPTSAQSLLLVGRT